jgi:hypothetical protein
MDGAPPQPVKHPPNLVQTGTFSLERLLSHIDPGTAEESEDFVRLIYEQRHIDLSSGRNGKNWSLIQTSQVSFSSGIPNSRLATLP